MEFFWLNIFTYMHNPENNFVQKIKKFRYFLFDKKNLSISCIGLMRFLIDNKILRTMGCGDSKNDV